MNPTDPFFANSFSASTSGNSPAMDETDFQQQLEQQLYLQHDFRVLHWVPVSGSAINNCYQLILQDQRKLLLKYHKAPPSGFYKAEAFNLQQLAGSGVIQAPAVIAQNEQMLVMEWIEPGPPSDSAQFTLGKQLARLHNRPVGYFGFARDNFCGLTPQCNLRNDDGFAFFSQQRLLLQGKIARDSGYLTLQDINQLEQLCQRLSRWIPIQQPALLHGDLWAGNFLVDSKDSPWLIDPACYYGWPESDLAMTRMFGGFSEAFYRGYNSERPIEQGFESRIDLYNLYHWLNHLNMFGSQYHSAVATILQRFGR
ncbi:MAG: fructosamine kinase family protein [Marinobacterium sp.]|nr:fructosamine kinase family protein [Marinobacterium sp.]